MLYRATRRVVFQVVIAFPVGLGANRAAFKTSTAIGAHVEQDIVDAVRAERAFKSANARVRGLGRKWFVAVFAGWAKFQHVSDPANSRQRFFHRNHISCRVPAR